MLRSSLQLLSKIGAGLGLALVFSLGVDAAKVAQAHYDPMVLEALNEAIRSSPDNARAYQSRGLIWIHVEDYESAIADFSEVIRIEPENSEAYIYRGTSYFWIQQYDAALQDLNRAQELDETVPVVYFNRGYVYRAQGEWEQAKENFQIGAELAREQDDRDTYHSAMALVADLEELSQLTPSEMLARGQSKMEQGDFLGAAADYTAILHARPAVTVSLRLTTYLQQGLAWAALGNDRAALNNFQQALQIDPDYALAYQEQGKIHLNQGDFDRALAAFAQALERDPDLPETYYQRGITRVEMGDYQGAIADFDAAIRRNPHYGLAYGGRGLAYFYLAEPDQALPDLNQALGLFQDQGNFPAYQQTLSLIAAIEAGESPTPSAPQPSGPILP